jgi:PAS domain S-box-containing protein
MSRAAAQSRALASQAMNFTRRLSSFDEFKPHGLKAERKVRAAFELALVCLFLIGIISYFSVSRLDQLEEWSRNTTETISTLRLVLSHVTDAETAQRGYAIVGDETYLAPYHEARRNIEGDFNSLRKLIAYDPEQQRRMEALMALVRERIARLAEEIDIRRSQGFAAAQAATVVGIGKRLHDRIRVSVGEMETAEQELLEARESQAKRSSIAAREIIGGGSVLTLVVMVLALITAEKDFGRRRAYAALLVSAGKLGRLGAWAVEVPSLRVTWSEEACAIHELPPGSSPAVEEGIKFYAPEFRESISAAFGACVREGTPFDIEPQIITAKGRRIWVRVIAEAERDAGGHIRRIQGALQDITERKEGVETLRRQQAELRVLFDLMPAMIWFKDTNDVILRINERAAAAAGKSVGEIEGRPSIETYPQDWAKYREDDLEVIHSGVSKLGIIEKLVARDGTEICVRTDKVPVRNEMGDVDGVIVMAHDITVNRSKDEHIRTLASIVENSGEAIVSKGLDGNIISWNPAAERLFGYTALEIIGRPIKLLFPPDLYNEEDENMRRLIEGDTTSRFEAVRIRKDGQRLDVAVTISPIKDSDGNVIGVSRILRDITDRKRAMEALRESETRFRELAENIDEVFWIADPEEAKKLYISPAYEKIWGLTLESAYERPHMWLDAIHPDDRDRVVRSLEIKKTQGTYEEEYRIIRPDGTERSIRDRAFPVRDAAGAIKRWVGVAEDVTKYRNLEEQLRQTQKMEAIGTLAGGIAHDFNNILTSISGYTELSQMILTGNDKVRDYLGSVLQAAGRATDLVRQILTFSRLERVERRLIQLRPVIAETIKLLRASIPSTIQFDISLATNAPMVLADATQIHQILMNLGTNAWHAMKGKPGRLEIKLERCPVDVAHAAAQSRLRPGLYARVSVSDTGSGMDQATQRRIFEPFFTTKPPGEGTGLGLSVVHGIMDSHDGAVTVYSHLGEGTVFHLYFPEHAGEIAAVGADGEPAPIGNGERILFVDDEVLLARLGQKTLTELGYEVECSTEPAEALATVRADPQRFALVLTDQTMPGMTGISLASQLRLIRPELPVILMTGYSVGLGQDQIDASGILQVLIKPTSIRSLGIAVHAALAPQLTH